MRFIVFLLCTTLASASICEVTLTEENAFDQNFHIRHFRGVKEIDGYVALGSLFPDWSNSFFIGINGNGHAYLIAGDHRYDGNPVFHTAKVRKHKSRIRNNTLLLKFDSVPQEVIDRLRNYLKEREGKNNIRDLTCYHGLCTVLEDAAGIRVRSENTWRSSEIYKSLFTTGVVGPEGKELPFEIYRVGQARISSFNHALKQREDHFRNFYGGVGVVIVGSVVVNLLWNLTH